MHEILLLVTTISVYYTLWVVLTSTDGKRIRKTFFVMACLLVAAGSWSSVEKMADAAQDRWNTWLIVREAQPEWHDRQKKIIAHYGAMIEKDYISPTCKYWDGVGTWQIHRERVRIHNLYAMHYQRVIMRDSQGSQYQGVKNALPREMEPCPAPERPARF